MTKSQAVFSNVENIADPPVSVFDELERLKQQREALERQISQLHSDSREDALKLVQKLVAQYEFTASSLGVAPVESSPKNKSLWSKLGGNKKSGFTVGPRKAKIDN
jgi:hypothetical protein